MKTTIFEIDVTCSSNDVEGQLESIIAQLMKISGVQSVDKTSTGASHKLLVGIAFSDADQAKTIHGKVMGKITAAKQVQVRGITTNLTDVFL